MFPALSSYRGTIGNVAAMAQASAAEIARANALHPDDDGSRYYERWLAALEGLVAGKQLVGEAELAAHVDAWDRAARATPHGQPVVLQQP